MKLRINLYTEEFVPKRHSLDFARMVLILCGAIVLLLLSGWWLHHRAAGLVAQVREQDALQGQIRQAIGSMQGRLGARTATPALQTELKGLGEELLTKQALLEHLHDWMPWRSHGFAQTLEDLARIHSANISLKGIQIEKGKLSLSGAAASSEDFPLWLGRFASAPSLSGKQFHVMSMVRDEKGILRFELSSQAARADEVKQ
jgi:hypothetical protein